MSPSQLKLESLIQHYDFNKINLISCIDIKPNYYCWSH